MTPNELTYSLAILGGVGSSIVFMATKILWVCDLSLRHQRTSKRTVVETEYIGR